LTHEQLHLNVKKKKKKQKTKTLEICKIKPKQQSKLTKIRTNKSQKINETCNEIKNIFKKSGFFYKIK
jgi:hypothetical protein